MGNTFKQIKIESRRADKNKLISIAEIYGKYEVAVLANDGDEIEMKTVDTIEEANRVFDEYANNYLGSVQKSVYYAGMEVGKKYTIAMMDELGLPRTIKITLSRIDYVSHAQYDDAVNVIFKMKGHRRIFGLPLYNQSFAIFEGWQELPDNIWFNESEPIEVRNARYYNFSPQYLKDMIAALKNPLAIYDNSKVGADGRIYA